MASAAQARELLDTLKGDVEEVKQAVLNLQEAGKRAEGDDKQPAPEEKKQS